MLESFDGKAIEFPSRREAVKWLEENVDLNSRSVFSAIPDFGGNFKLLPTDNLHRAAQVDVCVGQGEMGVGETGSVWVTDGSLGVPAAALLSTDLFLLLDEADIVGGIHDAYSRPRPWLDTLRLILHRAFGHSRHRGREGDRCAGRNLTHRTPLH